MSKASTKRKRPQKWCLGWWRAVGEFDDKGERRMTSVGRFLPTVYKSEKAARKGCCRAFKLPYKAFVYKQGFRQKGVIELQVFDDETYSGE